MAITINGKVYRNLQEQVYENTLDIDELKRMYGYRGPYDSTADIENPVDLGLYLIGSSAPYAIYQYHELTQNYTDLGLFNQRGPQGEQGIQGIQGPKGDTGDPVTITVNDEVYHSYMGNINLPDYPHDGVWGSIEGTLSDQADLKDALDAKQNIITDLDEIRAGAALGATAVQPATLDDYYDKEEIDDKLDLKANAADIPTKVSELENDENYVTAETLGTDYVTTATNQNIYATKTFKLDDDENDNIKINYSNIELYSQEPNEDYYDSKLTTTKYEIIKPTTTNPYDYEFQLHLKTEVNDYDTVYKFPFVANGNMGATCTVATTDMIPDTSNLVTTNTEQNITGTKHFINNDDTSTITVESDIIKIDSLRPAPSRDSDSDVMSLRNNQMYLEKYRHDTSEQLAHIDVLQLNVDGLMRFNLNGDQNFKVQIYGGETTNTYSTTYNFNYRGNENISGNVALTSDIPDVSNFVTDTELATTLEDYELAADAFSGNYNDLTNKPDLSVYELKSEAFSGDYDDLTNKPTLFSGDYGDLTNKPDLSVYELKSEAFSGDYNDLANKPTIPTVPTDVSAFTNDAGYITNSALSGYATETYVDTAISGLSIPTKTSDLTNDSGFITSSDLPTNYVTTDTTQSIAAQKTFTNNVNFDGNGSYYFTFNGRNPIKMIAPRNSTTGFTLYDYNNNEKGYLQYNSQQDGLYLGRYSSSSSSPTYVQDIGFLSETGSTGYKVLIPNLTVTGSASNNINYMAISVNDVKADSTGNITLDIPDVSDYYTKTEVDGLIPTATSDLTNDSGFITGITSSDVTTALGYTPGTSDFDGAYSSLTGTPDLSIYAESANLATVATTGSYDDLTDKPSIPDAVSGTNDGTNWTSLTIGSDTYSIPSGGGSSATANLFLHNFRLAFTTATSVTSYIEATILTKSSTQILTMAELATQIAALQATAYDDSVIGVIYGQWYRSNNTTNKENILGFGLTGSASSPNLYMTCPKGSTTSALDFVSTSSATLTISWINQLMAASGLEVAASCTDVVTPAII